MDLLLRQTDTPRGPLGGSWTSLEKEVAEGRLGPTGDDPPDLTVFPELSLTGYDLGHRARELALSRADLPPLRPDHGAWVVGFPERSDTGLVYNSAGVLNADGWLHVHRKRYLPTYGMFDEGRIFAPGRRGPGIFHPHPDWPTSLLICEELWHPALPYLAALQGAALLVVVASAPGRGRPETAGPPGFPSHEAWRLLARTTALNHGMYVALVNRSGVEGGVTFAGGSLVAGPDGRILAEAGPGPDSLRLRLELDRVRGARHPFSHLRDEDPDFLRRELDAILGRRTGPDV